MAKYKWQGVPVKVEFGYVYVSENEEKPLYWYNYECSKNTSGKALIEAVQITTNRSTFCISNHFGIGVHKLINGGWPSHAHFSFEAEEFKPYLLKEELMSCPKKFNEEEYSSHEAERRAWQRKNYPEEFERSESLRRLIIRH